MNKHRCAAACYVVASLILNAVTSAQPLPFNVSWVGRENLDGTNQGMAVKGSYAYVTTSFYGFQGGLQVIDVSNPLRPRQVGYCTMPYWTHNVEVCEPYVYVCCSSLGLCVVDISNPAAPAWLGTYDSPGQATGVAIVWPYAYVADNYAGLRIVDVSNPYQPVEVGYCETPGAARRVEISQGYAYVADNQGGLRIIDVTIPTAPIEAGSYSALSFVVAATVQGKYAYVADEEEGLRVVNVSNPEVPVEVGFCPLPGLLKDVEVSGPYAYIGCEASGMRVLDISTPTAPVQVGWFFASEGAYQVEVTEPIIYLETPSYLWTLQLAMPDLRITLRPLNPPIVVPANGGSFDFNVAVTNHGPTQEEFVTWTRIRYPDSTWTAPIFGPTSILPPLNVVVTRRCTQTIPATFPAGQYDCVGYTTLTYPGTPLDSSFFTFTKSTVIDGIPWIWDTSNSRLLSTDENQTLTATSSLPQETALSAYPNPFNATTVVSFELQDAGFVKLAVFDISGRRVGAHSSAPLVDGWREAGRHEITFDGSSLPSGMYIYRLEAGKVSANGKMVLMK